MTITLERPRAQAAYFDPKRVLPAAHPEAATTTATSPAAQPKASMPVGGRLVRRRTAEAPTLSLSRKLKMLAPVALLAGVSAGTVTIGPQFEDLLDGVRAHFANASATVDPDPVLEQQAVPKHRAATPDAPALVPAPRHHPTYQPKHRAPSPTDATAPTAETPAGPSSTGGSHAADHPSTATTGQTTGGKHKAPSSNQGDQSDPAPTKQDPAPPADQPPSSGSPSDGPVTDTVKSVTDTVKGVTGLVGLS